MHAFWLIQPDYKINDQDPGQRPYWDLFMKTPIHV